MDRQRGRRHQPPVEAGSRDDPLAIEQTWLRPVVDSFDRGHALPPYAIVAVGHVTGQPRPS
jgi:hypothetical protein